MPDQPATGRSSRPPVRQPYAVVDSGSRPSTGFAVTRVRVAKPAAASRAKPRPPNEIASPGDHWSSTRPARVPATETSVQRRSFRTDARVTKTGAAPIVVMVATLTELSATAAK